MKRIVFFVLMGLIGVSFAGENYLKLSSGAGGPGTSHNVISIYLDNSVPVRGVQLQIADTLHYMSPDTVWTVGRAKDFDVAYNPEDYDGYLTLILISAQTIPADTGKIMQISYSISPDAPLNSVVDLLFLKIIVTDSLHHPLEVEYHNGKFKVYPTSAVESIGHVDFQYQLKQNYPNPFNPTTQIDFSMKKDGYTKLEIFNLLGQHVRTLLSASLKAGSHSMQWDGLDENGKQATAGVYLYRLQSGDFVETKRLTLLR
ncbi:MAG: T9SS type A sorting domain-containing protein [Calditrichaeota bacterium]|nr:T9SS type A sorting domain-containing protein [Calditrichota bacterium]